MCSCANNRGLNQNDLEFKINGKSFLLDSDVTVLLKELGDNYELNEAPSCVYEGKDKTFVYEGIEIYTYPLNDKDMIDEILLTDRTYKTNREIAVGDTKNDLIKAYGEEFIDEGGIIKYSLKPDDHGSPCLYFQLTDDKIVAISYYSASNM